MTLKEFAKTLDGTEYNGYPNLMAPSMEKATVSMAEKSIFPKTE